MDNRQQLRQQLRARRRSLSAQQQTIAATRLAQHIQRQPLFLRSKNIAFYLPNDGEIDPQPLLQTALQLGKNCYLPVLQPFVKNRLSFVRYTATTRLRSNRFNIPEPVLQVKSLPARLLDIVLLPLVGFDQQGGRLGMGGGYYDRTLAFKHSGGLRKPYLLGLAHSCQQVESIPLASWDIALDAIVTDGQIFIADTGISSRDLITKQSH